MSAVHPIMQQALNAFSGHFEQPREDRTERCRRILSEVENDDSFLLGEFRRLADDDMFYSLGLDSSDCFNELEKLAAAQPEGPLKRALKMLHTIGRGMNSVVEREVLRRESAELAARR